MTILETYNRLRDRYVKWYQTASQMQNYRSKEDAEYSWWEREKECREWCSKAGTYVQMSDTKTLKIMREWVKECKIR